MDRTVRNRIRAALAVTLCATVWTLASPAGAQAPRILVSPVSGTITPVIADHLAEGVRRAEEGRYDAYLISMDTPGGLDTSMRKIIQAFLGSRVPVIVHVAPPGGRAASAGALIGLSANVLAMAPGTTIGAATPVDMQGGDISDKIVNDAAAYAESIARLRGRSVEFAGDAVRKGRAVTAQEAAELGVADLVVASHSELLEQLHGRTVTVAGDVQVELRTAGARSEEFDLGAFPRLRQWLADPNLAFLFMSLGTLAIIYELANPGIGGAGIAGVIMIALALFALSVLPVNVVGVLFLVLAMGLFVAEVFAPGVGVFAAGGTVSLLLSGVFLFRGDVGVSPAVMLPLAGVVGGGTVLAGRVAWRTRRAPQITGARAFVGQTATVRTADNATGRVMLEGAWWTVRTSGVPLEVGDRVRVTAMDGLELLVEPVEREELGRDE